MNFQDLALPYFDALYNFALVIAGNRRDAEDLVQETYLRAYHKFDQFDYGTNIKAWMFRIMRNIAVDNLRKRDALLTPKNEPYEDGMFAQNLPGIDLNTAIDLKKAIEELPEKYRVAIILKDIEGFNYGEIGDILNLPPGTVMSRLSRARQKLLTYFSTAKQSSEQKKIVQLQSQSIKK